MEFFLWKLEKLGQMRTIAYRKYEKEEIGIADFVRELGNIANWEAATIRNMKKEV